jgi:hypothetical protein
VVDGNAGIATVISSLILTFIRQGESTALTVCVVINTPNMGLTTLLNTVNPLFKNKAYSRYGLFERR